MKSHWLGFQGEHDTMTKLELPAPEFVERFQSGEIPASARVTVTFDEAVAERNRVLAGLHQWQRQTNTQTSPATSAREPFDRFDAEDAAMTGEEKRAESRLWAEVERGIRAGRAERP